MEFWDKAIIDHSAGGPDRCMEHRSRCPDCHLYTKSYQRIIFSGIEFPDDGLQKQVIQKKVTRLLSLCSACLKAQTSSLIQRLVSALSGDHPHPITQRAASRAELDAWHFRQGMRPCNRYRFIHWPAKTSSPILQDVAPTDQSREEETTILFHPRQSCRSRRSSGRRGLVQSPVIPLITLSGSCFTFSVRTTLSLARGSALSCLCITCVCAVVIAAVLWRMCTRCEMVSFDALCRSASNQHVPLGG